jgi:hypothetical protein
MDDRASERPDLVLGAVPVEHLADRILGVHIGPSEEVPDVERGDADHGGCLLLVARNEFGKTLRLFLRTPKSAASVTSRLR